MRFTHTYVIATYLAGKQNSNRFKSSNISLLAFLSASTHHCTSATQSWCLSTFNHTVSQAVKVRPCFYVKKQLGQARGTTMVKLQLLVPMLWLAMRLLAQTTHAGRNPHTDHDLVPGTACNSQP
jgi:hypothetical protein